MADIIIKSIAIFKKRKRALNVKDTPPNKRKRIIKIIKAVCLLFIFIINYTFIYFKVLVLNFEQCS